MRPFRFSPDDLKHYEAQAGEVQKDIYYYRSEKLSALASQVRLHVVKPFCRKHNLTFDTGMGQWSFTIAYPGRDQGKIWFVGEDRRPLPGRPEGIEGDDDNWWAPVTEEDRAIKKLLDRADDGRCGLGTWVSYYPDTHGE